jgi:hypothetical protein
LLHDTGSHAVELSARPLAGERKLQCLLGIPQAPDGAPDECDRERTSVGVTAKPRTQPSGCRRADDCIVRMMRESNRARSTPDAALLLLYRI